MVKAAEQPEDCSVFLQALINCGKDKKYTKFFGGCGDEEIAHQKCIMREHYRKRNESIEKSKGFKRGTQSKESQLPR